MAKGKYAKSGSSKGGLVLMVLLTLLVIGGCAVGIFLVLNGDQPQQQPGPETTQSTPAATTEASTAAPTAAPTTQPTEATTAPTEETTAPTEETTVPTEAETVPLPEGVTGVAQTALAQVGKPYKSGGNGPDSFDTSGFVYYCLKENGLLAKRQKLKQLVTQGAEVATEDLQPGDVVFFWTSNEGEAEYAGIYVGDGKFVAARNEENPVSLLDFNSNYFKKRYVTARRFGN